MADIAVAFNSLLMGDADVVALIGDRLFPNAAPQNPTEPYVTYGRVDTQHIGSFQGSGGLANVLMQFDIWGAPYSSVRSVADRFRLVLQGYKGLAGGVDVRGIIAGTEEDDWADISQTDGGEKVLHRVTMDFTAWFYEDKPT